MARGYDIFRLSSFRWFLSARFCVTLAIQMQSVIIGWQIYDITGDVLSLGLAGLAEAIPFIAAAVFSGYLADMFPRRRVLLITSSVYLLSLVLLFIQTMLYGDDLGLWFLYLLSGITGVVRSFNYPAQIALLAQIVPRSMYSEAAAWNSMAWQVAAIGGPAVAGLIYGFVGASAAYAVASSLVLLSLLLLFGLPAFPCPERVKGSTFPENLSSGLKFVFSKQLLVGSMSLDMFAVLFGGAVALLPVFASEVLNAGPEGLGVLRAAPAIGSIIMSLVLASYPPLRFAGKKLLISVAMFGVTTILFALSENFYISMLVLIVGGMFDNVSVVIRSTIVQLFTPDHLRGRVAAVNSVFIGSSNEIGAFESGLAARLLGLVPSVIFGGAMTLGIVGVITIKAPVLRELHLDQEIRE